MHFPPPFRFFLFFGSTILLSTLFQNTLNICSIVTTTDQVSCPYHSYSIAHFNFYDIQWQALKNKKEYELNSNDNSRIYVVQCLLIYFYIYIYIYNIFIYFYINSKKTSNGAIISRVHLHAKLKAPTHALALRSRVRFNSGKKSKPEYIVKIQFTST